MENLKLELKSIKDNVILMVMFILKYFTLLTCEKIVQLALKLDEKIEVMESEMTEVSSEEVSSEEETVEAAEVVDVVEDEEEKVSKVKVLIDRCAETVKSVKDSIVEGAKSFGTKCIEAYENCKEAVSNGVNAVKQEIQNKTIENISKFRVSVENTVAEVRLKNDSLQKTINTASSGVKSTNCVKAAVDVLDLSHINNVVSVGANELHLVSHSVAEIFRPEMVEVLLNPLVEVGNFENGKFRKQKLNFKVTGSSKPMYPMSSAPTQDMKNKSRLNCGILGSNPRVYPPLKGVLGFNPQVYPQGCSRV